MEALRAAGPLRLGDVTLVPIERSEIRSDGGEVGCWLGAFKEPVAVVVCDAGGISALAIDSSEIELDALLGNTSNLGAILVELSAL